MLCAMIIGKRRPAIFINHSTVRKVINSIFDPLHQHDLLKEKLMRIKKSIQRIIPVPNSIQKVDSTVWEILGLKYAAYDKDSKLIALCKTKAIAKLLVNNNE